jgi:hypothetical protein
MIVIPLYRPCTIHKSQVLVNLSIFSLMFYLCSSQESLVVTDRTCKLRRDESVLHWALQSSASPRTNFCYLSQAYSEKSSTRMDQLRRYMWKIIRVWFVYIYIYIYTHDSFQFLHFRLLRIVYGCALILFEWKLQNVQEKMEFMLFIFLVSISEVCIKPRSVVILYMKAKTFDHRLLELVKFWRKDIVVK